MLTINRDERRESLPIVIKNPVPIPFLKASTVDSPDPAIYLIDTYLIRSQSNNRSMLKMRSMHLPVLMALISSPENPSRREGTGPTSIGNSCQWREESRVDDESIDTNSEEAIRCGCKP
jgi:hypothetical protein